MKKDKFLFLDALGQIDDTFIKASSQPWQKEKAVVQKREKRNSHRPFFHIRHRWHVAAVMIFLPTMSVAAFASDDIREGIRQLRLQFFSDNVSIDSVQEDASQQTDSREEETSGEKFQAYTWKETPEGYQVVYEEEDEVLQQYFISFENSHGSYIEYSQTNVENSQHHISYDSQKGYKRIIELTDELEAYSISDGRNNTIFFEKNRYLFEFMSNQPEETILEYIKMSGILEYEN